MKKIIVAVMLLITLNLYSQPYDTLRQFSNQNILTIRDTVTNKISFVFDANGLTAEQFTKMRTNLEIELLFMRIYK